MATPITMTTTARHPKKCVTDEFHAERRLVHSLHRQHVHDWDAMNRGLHAALAVRKPVIGENKVPAEPDKGLKKGQLIPELAVN